MRRFHVERVKRHLDWVYELDAKNLLLVLGEYIWQKEVIPPEVQWGWAVENMQALGDYAADLGVEIALELEPFRLSLINDIDKMVQFIKDVNRPAVKANLDISHLTLANIPATDIQKLKGLIAHVHISDCDGKVHGDLPPGHGVVEFEKYLPPLKAVGFDGVMSIELEYSPEPAKIVEWVKEAYTATDKLMRDLGMRH